MSIRPCLYCEASVSTDARACPRCSESYPTGLPCAFCGVRMKLKEGFQVNGQRPRDMVVHAECADKFLGPTPSAVCHECGRGLAGQFRGRQLFGPIDCVNCGAPLRMGGCQTCHAPLFAWHDRYTREVSGLDGSETLSTHRFCEEAKLREAEFVTGKSIERPWARSAATLLREPDAPASRSSGCALAFVILAGAVGAFVGNV